jgi:hypothetical protein
MKTSLYRLAGLLGSLAALGTTQPAPAAPAAPTGEAVRVALATDVVRQWRPGQHLYVKGNVGAGDSTLNGLASWLAEQGTNWVAVLAESAEGETYTDAEGRTYRGVEAVNHALGKGLMNQTAFGQQVDSRTGERNAAFFVLFLKERRLSYYGSDAQDKRGLGEDHWVGNLDRAAVTAMRNGARVIDAVKDTVSTINRRLEDRIAAEARERQQRVIAEQKAREQAAQRAAAALEKARADYLVAETKSGEFSRRFPDLTGDLGRVEMTGLKLELAAIQSAVEQGDTQNAVRKADALRERVQALVRALEQYPRDGQTLEGLATQLQAEAGRPHASRVQGPVESARESLAAARREYERGDSSYVALLEAASRAVATARMAVAGAEAAALRQQVFLGMTFFSLLAGAAVVGLLLNRRRMPFMVEARHLHDLWRQALSEKTTALFALLDRRLGVLGESEEETVRRYRGGTLRLGRQIIQDVDELFIMSSCAGRILEQAGELVEPTGIRLRLLNLFARAPYRQAVALLRDHPIAFKPEEGLELVVRGQRTERDRLVGDLQSYRPFTMTFHELIEAFNQRAERALAGLEELENALLTAPDKFKRIQEMIDGARTAEHELASGTQEDGWFDLKRLFSDLLPSAQRHLARARQTAVSDPIDGLRVDGARANQQVSDATALVALVRRARGDVLPRAREAEKALAAQAIGSTWIGEALQQVSVHVDEAVSAALEQTAETEIAALEQAIGNLAKAATDAVALDQLRREQAMPQIAQTTAAVREARTELGLALELPAGETLREEGQDPTESLTSAQAQLEAAIAALSRGDLAAARNAIDSVGALTTQANQIVEETRRAFSAYAPAAAALEQEIRRIGGLVPEHAATLAQIRQSYAPAVLSLGAGDRAHPKANGTLEDNIQETEEHLGRARLSLDNAARGFRQARVLESAVQLQTAKQELDTALYRLSEIQEKRRRLTETEAANRRVLDALEQRRRECEALASQPTTMAATTKTLEAAAHSLEMARAAVGGVPRDPFTAADRLAKTQVDFDLVADQARRDREVHEQAGRSLVAAEKQLADAERIAQQSATDNLPDSGAVQQARGVVVSLRTEWQALQAKFQIPHGDWPALDEAASGIATRAAAAAATLKGELEQAEASVAALSAASDRVRAAAGWTAGYGVVILGAPGAEVLAQARDHLERGEYTLARQVAENARRAAERAIAQAQAEAQRQRLEEEERLERERRRRREEEARRMARRSSFPSGFGSSHAGGSSWGSSGSGARTSSFSSGSGVRTSSW